jgi:NAD(P)-dependent dehydrogenase (short-subunit alcohol dehydrogenase family)
VTGGNGGLGLETARELARKGAHISIAARNMEKAVAAEAEIKNELPGASLEVRNLDLSSLDSIRAFAAGVLAAHPVIDQLYNNAGVMATPEWQTADGFEIQFGTNHLGHFYLTYLLLPALLKADAGRVVTTTSTARFTAGDYNLDNPHMRGEYDAWTAYGYSKLANVHFTIELNQRLQAAGARVTAYSADPGFSITDLQAASTRNTPGGKRQAFFDTWVRRIGQSAGRGALPQLRAGTDPAAEPGSLWRPRWIARGVPVQGGIGRRLRKPADLQKLWEVSERELGIDFDVAAMVADAA